MDGTSLPTSIGKFRVVRFLGEGAMGRVYLGVDSLIDRQVAIKVMTVAGDAESQARFRNEARAAGQLSHPNIVQVYEFGLHEDRPYLAMEFLEGCRLDEWLTSPRSDRQKMAVLLGLCRALEHAHRRGILHRDVKPANLQILPDGTCKLMDFGIARMGSAQLTATGMVLGTPEFIAPETLHDASYSPRTDNYAVGLVAYWTLSGDNPFRASTLQACLHRVLSVRPEPLAQLCPNLPTDLCRAVDQLLLKDPEQRPTSLEPLIEALEHSPRATAEGLGPSAAPSSEATVALGERVAQGPTTALAPSVASMQVPAPVPAPIPAAPAPAPTTAAPAGRRHVRWGVAAAVVVLLVAVGSWGLLRKPAPVETSDVITPPPVAASQKTEPTPAVLDTGALDTGAPDTGAPDGGAPDTDDRPGAASGSSTAAEIASASSQDTTAQDTASSQKPRLEPAASSPGAATRQDPRRVSPSRPGSGQDTPSSVSASPNNRAAAQDSRQVPSTRERSIENAARDRLPAPPTETAGTVPQEPPVVEPSNTDSPAAQTTTAEPRVVVAETIPPPTQPAPVHAPPPPETTTTPGPVILRITPTAVRRGGSASVTISGSGFDKDLRVVLTKGERETTFVSLRGLRLAANGDLVGTVFVRREAPLGEYSLTLRDKAGRESNTIPLQVSL